MSLTIGTAVRVKDAYCDSGHTSTLRKNAA
jgi:hypothetical protein